MTPLVTGHGSDYLGSRVLSFLAWGIAAFGLFRLARKIPSARFSSPIAWGLTFFAGALSVLFLAAPFGPRPLPYLAWSSFACFAGLMIALTVRQGRLRRNR
jgi:hypothetical protein